MPDVVIGPTDTFSISEDEASSSASSLFSPVNNDMVLNTNSTKIQILSCHQKALIVSPLAQDCANKPSPKEAAGQTRVIEKSEEKEGIFAEVSKQDNGGLKLQETRSAIELEMEYLQKLVCDMQALHVVAMKLKDIEIQKMDIALRTAQKELLEAQQQLEEQTKVFEALTTTPVTSAVSETAVPPPSMFYWESSALPEMLVDVLI
jgi:hypothetical protein